MSYPIRMYHPDLGVDLAAYDEGQEAIYAEAGWVPGPDPRERPGLPPEWPRYERGDDGKFHPVFDSDPKPEPKSRRAKPTD